MKSPLRHATAPKQHSLRRQTRAPERLRRRVPSPERRGRTGHRLCRCRYRPALAGRLAGKVVIDITNPLTADYMGLTIGHDTSAAEEIAKAVPGAEVIKAFNTVFAQCWPKVPIRRSQGHRLHCRRQRTRQGNGSDIGRKHGFRHHRRGLKNARYLRAALAA